MCQRCHILHIAAYLLMLGSCSDTFKHVSFIHDIRSKACSRTRVLASYLLTSCQKQQASRSGARLNQGMLLISFTTLLISFTSLLISSTHCLLVFTCSIQRFLAYVRTHHVSIFFIITLQLVFIH